MNYTQKNQCLFAVSPIKQTIFSEM